MINVVVITGRGGSKSVPRKNVIAINRVPTIAYPIKAALSASNVDEIYVSTDCEEAKKIALGLGVGVIDRPPELCRDDSELGDALKHALDTLSRPVRYLIQMHGNCVIHKPGLIDEGIRTLDENPHIDSSISGVIDLSIHPIRTKRMNEDGLLEPWLEVPPGTSTNRQALSPCFRFDGAARILRVATCFSREGQAPYTYMGRSISPLFNPQGFDIHTPQDVVMAENLLASGFNSS